MHKRKDGKIIASLTEVKNKTGDIFSLVDEFGEVTLTSYNKPKYRITKVDILETLKIDEEQEKEEKKKEPPKKNVIQKVAETLTTKEKKEPEIKPTEVKEVEANEVKVETPKEEKSSPVPKVEPEVKKEVKEEEKNSGGEDISDFKVWDRNNNVEMSFIKKILLPLQ